MYLTGDLNATWSSVYGAADLNVPVLSIVGVSNSSSTNMTGEGFCEFSGWSKKWSGLMSINFDLYQYNNTSFKCFMDSATSEVVFRYLTNQKKSDAITSKIEFSYGVDLSYNASYNIFSFVYFLGIPGTIQSNFDTLPSFLEFFVGINNFTVAYGNLIGKNLEGDLEVYSTYSVCRLEGIFEIWSITQASALYVSSNMYTNVTGNIFDGIYNTTIYLKSKTDYFNETIWIATFNISQYDIQNISQIIATNLNTWAGLGQYTLKLSSDTEDSLYNITVQSSSNLCSQPCEQKYSCSPVNSTCLQKYLYYNCTNYTQSYNATIKCTNERLYCTDTNCNQTVSMCDTYDEDVYANNYTSCTQNTLEQVEEDCLLYGLECKQQILIDETCQSLCLYYQSVYDHAQDDYEIALRAGNLTLSQLGVFDEFNGSELFEIYSAGFNGTISEPGISSGDLNVTVELGYYQSGSLANYTVNVLWDFFSNQINANTLTKEIISLIVSSSDTLSQELLVKTPLEIYYENYFND